MSFINLEAVLMISFFLMPGFIIQSLIEVISPVNQETYDNKYLVYFGHTIFFYAFYSVMSPDFLKRVVEGTFQITMKSLLAILIASIIWGIVAGVIVQKRYLYKLLGLLKIRTIDPTPTAWEKCFYRNRVYWLMVQLANGEIIYGKFASNSAASSTSTNQDLFLETVYDLDSEGVLQEKSNNHGVWINANQITLIGVLR